MVEMRSEISADTFRELWRHQKALERLARRLVRETGGADDLVQETWRRTLERPPSHLSSASGWLKTVARNLVREISRRRTSIDARFESISEDGSPHQRLEDRETARAIAEAVDRLPEEYRRVVIGRFFDDQDTDAIAHRFSMPAATVRTHLDRGLAQLRGELERRFKGTREYRSALFGLAGSAAGSGRVKVAGKIVVQSATTSLKVKSTVAALATVALLLPIWVLNEKWKEDDRIGGEAGRRAAAPMRLDARRSDDRADRGAETSPTSDGSPAAEFPVGEFEAKIRLRTEGAVPLDDDRMIVTFARVDEAARQFNLVPKSVTIRQLSPDPTVSITALFPDGLPSGDRRGVLSVTVNHPKHVPVELLFDLRRSTRTVVGNTVVFDLLVGFEPTQIIMGRIVDERGEPWTDALIGVFPMTDGQPEGAPIAIERANGEGRFEMRSAPSDHVLVVAMGEGAPPLSVEANWSGVRRIDLGTLTLVSGVKIGGSVMSAGRPIAGALLRCQWRSPKSEIELEPEEADSVELELGDEEIIYSPRTRIAERSAVQTYTGEDGRFEIVGLCSGDHWIDVTGLIDDGADLHPDVTELLARRVTAPTDAADFDVPIARLKVAVHGDGADLPDATAVVVAADEKKKSGDVAIVSRKEIVVRAGVAYDIAGGCPGYQGAKRRIAPLAPGEVRNEVLELTEHRGHREFILKLRGAEAADVESVSASFVHAPPVGEITDDPLAIWRNQRGTFFIARAVRSGDDTFAFEGLDLLPGRWQVFVNPIRKSEPADRSTVIFTTTVDLEVPAEGTISAQSKISEGVRLRVVVRKKDGIVVSARCRVWSLPDRRHVAASTHGGGDAFAWEGYCPAGEYEVLVTPTGSVVPSTHRITVDPKKPRDYEVVVD